MLPEHCFWGKISPTNSNRHNSAPTFTIFANLAARALYHTQLRQEINEHDGQLVGLQLFTKSLTGVSMPNEILDRIEKSCMS